MMNILKQGTRLYSRWRSRKPVNAILGYDNLINPDEPNVIDLTNLPKGNQTQETKTKEKLQTIDTKKIVEHVEEEKIQQENPPSTLNSGYFLKDLKKPARKPIETVPKPPPPRPIKTVFNEEGEIVYEKLGYKDVRISNLILQAKMTKQRLKNGLILVEGRRLVIDGLQAGCTLKNLIVSDTDDLVHFKPYMPKSGPVIYKMPYAEMRSFSDLDTCPGIMGIFEMPKPVAENSDSNTLPLNVVCDNIREPGNLGSVLRISLGLGCKNVILTKGCVDLWNPKVLRSAAGAHFRLPIHANKEWSEIDFMLQNTAVFIADNNTDEVNFDKMRIISSNKNLDSEKIISKFAARKHQLNSVFSEDTNDQPKEETVPNVMFPLLPYYGLDYTNYKSITILIGGETEGISEESYRFGINKDTMRLHVPLTPGVDSLNSSTAFAVIAFEIKRQFLTHQPRVLEQIANN